MNGLVLVCSGLVAVLIALWVVKEYLNFAGKRRVVVVATIFIEPSGKSKVSFDPPTADAESLIRLALVYAAKLRWVIGAEPPESTEIFECFLHEAIDVWPTSVGQRLLPLMPSVKELYENAPVDHKWSAPHGERFVVRLTEWRRWPSVLSLALRNSGIVWNSLPRPGLSFNLVWNYMLLLDQILPRLDAQTLSALKEALAILCMSLFSEWAGRKPITVLFKLTRAANAASEAAMVNAQRRDELG